MSDLEYVIIGNSAGSVGCIEGLRSIDQKSAITLVAEEDSQVYSRALLPYYISGRIAREKMYFRPRDFYERNQVNVFSKQQAVKIDISAQEVILNHGRHLKYSKLLLATGGKPILPPITGLDTPKQNLFTFHNMDDLLGIERELARAKSAVVLGGGVIGLMAAEALHKRGIEVHVVELAQRLLAPVVDQCTSQLVAEALRVAGAQLYLNNTLREAKGTERVESVVLQDGTEIDCDLLIVGVGVTPRVELATEADILVNRGIVVDEQMRTSVQDIFACGDCAVSYNFATGEAQNMPLWPNAYAGGRVAGTNMAGETRDFVQATAMNAMHFFDVQIINAGVNVMDLENKGYLTVTREYNPEDKIYRKFVLSDQGCIKGYLLVGGLDRAGIFLNLMRHKIDVRPFQSELLRTGFGYADLPDQLRWNLLCDDVILGVV